MAKFRVLFASFAVLISATIPIDSQEESMRQSLNETFANQLNRRLFSVDFHDFLEKEAVLNDVELSQEFGLSIRDVQKLRKSKK